jgi:hypothetical protein
VLTAYTRKGLTLAAALGFGVGLMAGAVFVAAKGGVPSDAEIVARARTLGMVLATELPAPAPAPAPVQQPAPEPVRIAVLNVPKGADFTRAAAELKALGVIADVNQFLDRVEERKLASKLKIGVHQLPLDGLTADKAIDILTGAAQP